MNQTEEIFFVNFLFVFVLFLFLGLKLAEDVFGIPQIISAENMTNKNLDELSMMTYLSYFTKDNGIGQLWTLNLVNKWNLSMGVTNFNKDWNDGSALSKFLKAKKQTFA